MRDPIENVSLLQKQLNTLQLENQILKNILDRSGVSYMQELKHLREPEGTESFDLNQGARIIHPKEIVTVQNPLFTAGQSQHFRQKQQSMPHRR